MSSAVIVDHDGRTICRIDDIKGDGGRFGSRLNLLKDGAKSTGAKLGEFIADNM